MIDMLQSYSKQTKQLQPFRIGEFLAASLPGVPRAVAPLGPVGHQLRDWPT